MLIKKINKQIIMRSVFAFLIVCWMLMIYKMSAKNGTQSVGMSSKIVDFLENELGLAHFVEYGRMHFLIRKMAHFTEYGVLSILSVNFLLTYNTIKKSILCKQKRAWIYLSVILFCLINAGLDEYHQSFVAGREPAVRDVVIDTFGAATFLCFFIMLYRYFSTKKCGNVHK